MKFHVIAAVATAALGLALAQSATAGPVGGIGATAAPAQTLVEQVHGCHRYVAKGRAGWHRHVGPNCRRVAAGPYRGTGKRYRWRGPRCETYCVGIGPVRVCDKDCG